MPEPIGTTRHPPEPTRNPAGTLTIKNQVELVKKNNENQIRRGIGFEKYLALKNGGKIFF